MLLVLQGCRTIWLVTSYSAVNEYSNLLDISKTSKFRNSDYKHSFYSAANRKYDVESRINLNQKAVRLVVNCVFIL